MRRSDREIKDLEEIVNIMKKCDVCRLALHDEEYPYILPLNFGMKAAGKDIILYFHGANEGTKYRLIRNNNKVSFEMDCSHRLVSDSSSCNCTMEFESVIGNGIIEFIDNYDEKLKALCILMEQYHADKDFKFDETVVPRTTVMKLTVNSIVGKKLMK